MVKYTRVGTVSVGVRHTIRNTDTMVDDVGVVIVGILMCRVSTDVTVDNDKLLI